MLRLALKAFIAESSDHKRDNPVSCFAKVDTFTCDHIRHWRVERIISVIGNCAVLDIGGDVKVIAKVARVDILSHDTIEITVTEYAVI